jgi:hypothetical protein
MMDSRIVSSGGVSGRFVRWTKAILASVGPDLEYGSGAKSLFKHSIRTPVATVHLLNTRSYKREIGMENDEEPFLSRSKIARPEDYDPSTLKHQSIRQGLADKPYFKHDLSLGCWRPVDRDGGQDVPGIVGEIFLCIDGIREVARRIAPNVPEVNDSDVEEYTFRTALLHEIGHQFTFANFSLSGIPDRDDRDALMIEGLASWFANMLSKPNDRLVQAEIAAYQPAPYRIYQLFKHSDITELLRSFISDASYASSSLAFSKVVGGRLNMNGHIMKVGEKADGVLFDWSDRGGYMVAGSSIKGLVSFSCGIFISPIIDFLIGRYPKETLVIAGKITNVMDYGSLPSNVKIIGEERVRKAITICADSSADSVVPNVLAELGFDNDNIFT